MRAQESLVLSLLSTAAVALPSTTGKSCKAHKQVSQSNDHIAELRAQASSLRAELSSVYAAPSQACRAKSTGTVHGTVPTAGFTAAFTAAMSSGAPTATAPAAYETFFSKVGPVSRLTPTSAASEDAPAPSGYGNGMDSYGSASSGAASSDAASGAASSEAPFPTFSTYSNGTSVNHAATGAMSSSSSSAFSSGASGAVSSTASLSSSASSTASSTSSSSTGVSPTYIPKMSDFSVEEFKSGEAFKKVAAIADERMKARDLEGGCTYENAAVRTEFRAMSKEMRKQFTDSVTCLKNMPPQNADLSAYGGENGGVKSRYDEYVATHIENTFKIHNTADFLAWHRHFIFEFESDLKNSCGYTGTLPYWDWTIDAQAVDKSEIFNGDEYSMGGNGEYIAGRADTYLGLQDLNFPPGTGGGCVYSGPFSNTTFTTNLGPIDSPYNNNVVNQFDANPRCLVRDLNSWFSQKYLVPEKLADLVIGEDSVQYFQGLMQGYVGDNKLGVHGGGHWVGGGPSQLEDFHSSPNDPVFYIHHAMIDRAWTVWQYMDRETRQNQIYGTDNLEGGNTMTLQDSLPFGLVAPSPVLGDLMDTLAGPYCYRYE